MVTTYTAGEIAYATCIELTTELAKIDAAISSRATVQGIMTYQVPP